MKRVLALAVAKSVGPFYGFCCALAFSEVLTSLKVLSTRKRRAKKPKRRAKKPKREQKRMAATGVLPLFVLPKIAFI